MIIHMWWNKTKKDKRNQHSEEKWRQQGWPPVVKVMLMKRLVHELAYLQRLPGNFVNDNIRDSLKRALEGWAIFIITFWLILMVFNFFNKKPKKNWISIIETKSLRDCPFRQLSSVNWWLQVLGWLHFILRY